MLSRTIFTISLQAVRLYIMTEIKITLELDDDLIADYLGGFVEAFEAIELNLKQLEEGESVDETYHDMLRHLHSIKGNARMCELTIAERIAHVIESVVIAVRESHVDFFADLGETIQVSLEKVKESSEKIFNQQPLDESYYLELINILEAICNDISQIRILTNRFLHITTNAPLLGNENLADKVIHTEEDLKIFEVLGERFKPDTDQHQGKIERLSELACEMNELAGSPVDSIQLRAAIFLQDINETLPGVDMLVRKFNIKPGNNIPVSILMDLGGWEEAISFLDSRSKTDGAAIIHLVNFYDSKTYPSIERDYKQSILQTLSEIRENSEQQFQHEWAEKLNHAVRSLMTKKRQG